MLPIELLVKGTALIAVVFAIASLLRNASAATRHLVWACGLAGMLLLPLAIAMPWRIPVVPALTERAVVGSPDASPWGTTGEGAETAAPTVASDRAWNDGATVVASGAEVETGGRAAGEDASAIAGPSDVAGSTATGSAAAGTTADAASGAPVGEGWLDRLGLGTPIRLIVAVWALGTLVVVARYLSGLWAVRRIVSRARRVDEEAWEDALAWAADRLLLDASVRLYASDEVPMPLTAGVLRPVVVLPTSALEWSLDRRRAVLVHELAHVRRKDALAHALTWVAMAVWWFHPLVRVTARRLRAESERACDDLVLRAGTRASSYADHLLEIVCASDSRAPAAAMPLAQRSEFEGRMIRILAPDARRHGLSALRAVAMAAVVFAITVPLAAVGMAGPRPADPAGPVAEAAREAETTASDETGPWGGPIAPVDGESDRVRETDRDTETQWDDEADSGVETTTEVDVAAGRDDASGAAMGGIDLSLLEGLDEKTPREWLRDGARVAGAVLRTIPADVAREVARDGRVDADELRDTVLPGLLEALLDESPEVRATVARALGEIDDPRAIEALMRALREDADADVRKMAAWALGEIESPRAIPGLARAIREDSAWEVRKMAAWSLGEIEGPEGVAALRVALGDDHAEVRETAVWALGEIEDPAAVPALVEALRDGSVGIRQKAAWALGEIESPSAVDPLVAALGDVDAEVRQKAAWALGEIEDPRAVPGLSRALSDGDRKTRVTAAWALGELDLESTPPALIEAVSDSDPEVREKAAWALGEIEDPAAVPALRGLLDDPNAKVRKTAVWALTEIEAPGAYEALVELLRDEDPEVRKAAARALGDADVDWDTDTDADTEN